MKTSVLNVSKRSRYDDRKHQDLQQHAAANHLQQWSDLRQEINCVAVTSLKKQELQ